MSEHLPTDPGDEYDDTCPHGFNDDELCEDCDGDEFDDRDYFEECGDPFQ